MQQDQTVHTGDRVEKRVRAVNSSKRWGGRCFSILISSPPRLQRDAAGCHSKTEAVKKSFPYYTRRLAHKGLGKDVQIHVLAKCFRVEVLLM